MNVASLSVLFGWLLLGQPAWGLSEFETFRSYPYLDKAYRAAEARDWPEVQRLMEHLIKQVPGNVEAYRLLAQSLEKQGDLEGAVAALGALDANIAAVQINLLRQTWIADGRASADEIALWLSETSGGARTELWRARADLLRTSRGPQAALDWLATLFAKGDSLALDRYRASLSEQLQHWTGVIEALVPHALEGTLEDDDWRRLAIAMIQTDNASGVNAMIARLPDGQLRHFVLRAAADRAIALGYSAIAHRWLDTLHQTGALDRQDEHKLLHTALAVGDTDKVRRLAQRVDMDCLTLADWLADQRDPTALATFTGCDPAENPERWLVLADRLDAVALLETTPLPEAWHQRRDRVLLDRYRRDGLDAKALALLERLPQDASTLRERAELTQQQHRPLAAAALWERHYLATGAAASLDQASYLYLISQRPHSARRLLERALHSSPHQLSAQALARLAQLYSEDSATVDAVDLATLASQPALSLGARDALLENVARHGSCDVVGGLANASVPPWGSLGICSRDRPGQAAGYFARDLAEQQRRLAPDEALIRSRKRLAYALFTAGDPAAAWAQWQQLPPAALSRADRLAGARSALASGDDEAALRWWDNDTSSATSTLLGARIAEARGDAPAAWRWRPRQPSRRQATRRSSRAPARSLNRPATAHAPGLGSKPPWPRRPIRPG